MSAEVRREIGELLAEHLPPYEDWSGWRKAESDEKADPAGRLDQIAMLLADRDFQQIGHLSNDDARWLVSASRQARSIAARLWDELAKAQHDCEQLRGRAETAEAELKSALAALSEQQQEER